MPRDPRYDILFEPVKIGPVTAPNRFYQVPHCNGMGYRWPKTTAAMRKVKAEGGWGVVCTEECEIHHTSDISPFAEARLWDDRDIPNLARMTEAVHAHGSLAGIELTHNSRDATNRYSREALLAPSHLPARNTDPVQARAMDKTDIKNFRRWHREAALRAKQAGFDIVYVYAAHDLTLLSHFLSRRHNHRSDEYGGSLENRARLIGEVLQDTKEAVGDSCGIAFRFAVEELMGADGLTCEEEGRAVVEMFAEIPDLWDVNVADWSNDSVTSRFGPEGEQEPYIDFVKKVTSKPVVGVGRFTSPDAMVSQIKRGVLDMIGAARPSIADPFLPKKIEEGRLEEIRECIGCNICVSGDFMQVPMRCTQNPTMGEEYRRGWHPERIEPKGSDDSVLIVGAGPAGLEAARALGKRGYQVTLAEATEELGGRVSRESRLPGLNAWARVRDYRTQALEVMPNVEIYRASALTAADIRDFGFQHVALATGCSWRHDGIGHAHYRPIPGYDRPGVVTPDAIIAGAMLAGPVVVYDDDRFYMAGLLAEKLSLEGHAVTLVTPAATVSDWTSHTMEQGRIQRRLLDLGVELLPQHDIVAIGDDSVDLSCAFTGKTFKREAASVVLVTCRLPDDHLYHELTGDSAALEAAGIKSVTRIGDCLAPATIAAAVYAGHRYARELDTVIDPDRPYKREAAGLPEE